MSFGYRHPRFTLDQVHQYYDRLHIAQGQRVFDVKSLSPEDSFDHLALMLRQHLAWVPFENLSLHYSQWRQVSLQLDDLFAKIILSPGRGGYCMEVNALFATLLRTLGYKLRCCGARVYNGQKFMGWAHQVNLVTIGVEVFAVDVGYGTNNMVVPLSLSREGEEVKAIHRESIRLVKTGIDDNEDPEQKLWVYQHRKDPDNTWRHQYCFSEVEFRPEDFEVMNLSTSQSPRIFFTQVAICTKMILDETGNRFIGRLTLQTELKRTMAGEPQIIQEFKSEADRLAALKEFFDIDFNRSEAESIKGTTAEIKDL